MKRFATALMITGAALFAGVGTAAAAGYNDDAAVGVDNPTPAAGASFSVAVSDCTAGTTVTFTFEGATETDVADDAGAATATFTAPTAAGTYSGTATCGDTVLSFGINVAATATTAAPGGELPATGGGSGSGTTMGIAALMLAAGVGMFAVAQVRRRQTAAA